MEHSGIAYQDWTARQEIKDKPRLHLYLELKENSDMGAEDVALNIDQRLKELDSDYADLESFLGLRPLEVTLLPGNAFQAYMLQQQAAGTDLARMKIPHINPSDSMLDFLISGERKVPVPGRKVPRREPVASR
jgi:hypothetical protein